MDTITTTVINADSKVKTIGDPWKLSDYDPFCDGRGIKLYEKYKDKIRTFTIDLDTSRGYNVNVSLSHPRCNQRYLKNNTLNIYTSVSKILIPRLLPRKQQHQFQ